MEKKLLPFEPKLTLNCPYCGESILETLGWFKKTYSTCPYCENGLAASQFSTILADLEQAMDENIEKMLFGSVPTSCCGKEFPGC